jgi:hypothetical protein
MNNYQGEARLTPLRQSVSSAGSQNPRRRPVARGGAEHPVVAIRGVVLFVSATGALLGALGRGGDLTVSPHPVPWGR